MAIFLIMWPHFHTYLRVSITAFINDVNFLFQKKLNHIWWPRHLINGPQNELKDSHSFYFFKGCHQCFLGVILWHTDCQMVSALITAFKKCMRGSFYQSVTIRPYHPQASGQAKRAVQTIDLVLTGDWPVR